MDVQVSGLDIQDIVAGIHRIPDDRRRGGRVRFEVEARTNQARYAKGTIALLGISNTGPANDLKYEFENLDFRLDDQKVIVEFDVTVGDSDGALDQISYLIYVHS